MSGNVITDDGNGDAAGGVDSDGGDGGPLVGDRLHLRFNVSGGERLRLPASVR